MRIFPWWLCFGCPSVLLAQLTQGAVAATPDFMVVLVMPSYTVALQQRLGEQQRLRLCLSQPGGCKK